MIKALDLDGVTCTFPASAGSPAAYTAVAGVDLRVGEGEFVAVVGPTGCGIPLSPALSREGRGSFTSH